MKTTKATWLKLLFLCATLAAAIPAYAFYSPAQQRWLNRDPLGEPGFDLLGESRSIHGVGGANLYLYVENNPITKRDPFGLQIVLPPGTMIIIPCPGAIQFITCVMYCAQRGQGIPVGLPLCALGSDGKLYVGCPCSGVFKKPRTPLACL
ncbi:MAG: hypothetical protein HOP33_21670 [Verrucomicrobia bacterium]|nr:hypothetical protein [Verrucomicrobiota bacterium]